MNYFGFKSKTSKSKRFSASNYVNKNSDIEIWIDRARAMLKTRGQNI